MRHLFFTLLFLPLFCNAQLLFSEQSIEMGTIAEAYEMSGDVILSNEGSKKIFLLRADADRGVKVYTSKKTLLPGDTCLLVLSFIPEKSGKFRKKILLIASDKETPHELTLSGTLTSVKVNDRMACVYFGNRRPRLNSGENKEIVLPEAPVKKVNSSRMDTSRSVTSSEKPRVTLNPQTQTVELIPKNNFSEADYKPNNILFLVDISSSMRDSLKLPVMKIALHKLIDAIRTIDTITFVTYATKVKIIKEAVSGADKTTLHTLVDSLRARGMTAGKTAILFSQQLAQKHFIQNGNNQIIIASDGEFKFEQEDYLTWKKRQGEKKIILSTVAFGNEKPALRNLRGIAYKGEGSFIHINQKNGSEDKLLNEIKMRSKRP